MEKVKKIEKEKEKKEIEPENFEGKIVQLCFGKDKNKNKKNWVSFLQGKSESSGKVVLLDKSQLKDGTEVMEGAQYECLIKKELENVAFAKIISKSFEHKLIVKENNDCIIVTQTNQKVERILLKGVTKAFDYFRKNKIDKFEVLLRFKDFKIEKW